MPDKKKKIADFSRKDIENPIFQVLVGILALIVGIIGHFRRK